MAKVTSICVFCGSRMGMDPTHAQAALHLGTLLADRGIRLIYGGGGIGLMGQVAQATVDAGGQVTGIIPTFLQNYELGGPAEAEVIVVDSMHERKRMMFERADAFVILPGGLGTLDEAIEITTWKQLQRHQKPIIFLNEGRYWNPFLALIDHVVENGYGHGKVKELYSVVDTVEAVFDAIAAAPAPDEEVFTSHL
ncbi:MAG: TIGR00730 family Rossman fold protein [Magnetospiraceae bacterium]